MISEKDSIEIPSFPVPYHRGRYTVDQTLHAMTEINALYGIVHSFDRLEEAVKALLPEQAPTIHAKVIIPLSQVNPNQWALRLKGNLVKDGHPYVCTPERTAGDNAIEYGWRMAEQFTRKNRDVISDEYEAFTRATPPALLADYSALMLEFFLQRLHLLEHPN